MSHKPPVAEHLLSDNKDASDWTKYYFFAREKGITEDNSIRYADKMLLRGSKKVGLVPSCHPWQMYDDKGTSLIKDISSII